MCALSIPLSAQPSVEPVHSAITVAENVSAETPASVRLLQRLDLERAPGVNLDDRLRLLPGFTLFRRTSSIAANPTTQGVSLRGIGSTGASRTLVLWDGIPLNSPYGGWIYWTRLAPEEVERIEVTRGASTSLFGDKAMGGSLNILTRTEPHLTASLSGGNYSTAEAALSAAHKLSDRWSLSGHGRAFTTDGYYIVPASQRGPIDTPAGVRFTGGALRADYTTQRDRLWLRADLLVEDRANGTVLQRNSTSLGTVAANYARDRFSVLAFHSREEYRASFSSIGTGRQTERLTQIQSVPADATGSAAFYSARFVTVGGDSSHAVGRTQGGLFAQSNFSWKAVRVFAGLRQQWTSNEHFLAPSAGITYGLKQWRLRTSGYRSFRAPTPNELFRDFRQGNSLTLANPNLQSETLIGVEAGADYVSERTRISLTAYRNRLDNLITNVTLSSTAQLITRQRRNAVQALSRGVELDARRHVGPITAELSYLLVDSRFQTGERLPQVARHQGSAQLTWRRFSAGLRTTSYQFEDDRNAFLLPGYLVWHATASQPLPHRLTLSVSIENALNHTVIAGYSPTPLTGAPRLVRAGLRWSQ